jgi:hypothetical protein
MPQLLEFMPSQIKQSTQTKNDLDHCIRCKASHPWTRRMLLQYGDKKRSVLAILCDRCGDEHRRMNLKEAKIVDLHEAAFAVLKSMMP